MLIKQALKRALVHSPVGKVLAAAATVYCVGTVMLYHRRANRFVIPSKVERFTDDAMKAMDAAGDDFEDEEEQQSETVPAAPAVGVPTDDKAALMFGTVDAGVTMAEAGLAPPSKTASSAPRVQSKARQGRHITVKVALDIKAKLGLLKRTDANILLLQRAGRKIMEERGMRPAHIATFLPIAVELALTPSRAEIEAVQMRATSAALERDDNVKATWLSFGRWFDPFQWTWMRRRGLAVMPK